MRIPVNMATPGLDVCKVPGCTKQLILKSEAGYLDVSLHGAGAYHADTDNLHEHQPNLDGDAEVPCVVMTDLSPEEEGRVFQELQAKRDEGSS